MGDIQFFSRHDIVKKATGIRFRGVDIRITVLYHITLDILISQTGMD